MPTPIFTGSRPNTSMRHPLPAHEQPRWAAPTPRPPLSQVAFLTPGQHEGDDQRVNRNCFGEGNADDHR